MRSKIILFLLGSVTTLVIEAQQKKFTVGVGYERTWMLDKQASPLKYQSSEKTVLLAYDRTGDKGVFNVQLNGGLGDFFPTGFKGRQMYDPGYNSYGRPKNDSSYIPGTLYNARIKLSYLRQTASGYSVVGKGKLYSHDYFGASLNNQTLYSDNIVRTGWLNSASINGEYFRTVNLNGRHFFSLKLSIPLFAVNSRLPYHNTISSPSAEGNIKTFFKQGSDFAWLANFQDIQIDASYEYDLSSHFSMGVRYFGQWLHYINEKPINLIQNNIGITAALK